MARREPLGAAELRQCSIERFLDPRSERNVLHPSTLLANEVVMVLGEVLSQFVARMIRPVHQAPDHARFLQYCKISVRRTLRERGVVDEQLRERERRRRRNEDLHDPSSYGRVPLLATAETLVHESVELVIGGGHLVRHVHLPDPT